MTASDRINAYVEERERVTRGGSSGLDGCVHELNGIPLMTADITRLRRDNAALLAALMGVVENDDVDGRNDTRDYTPGSVFAKRWDTARAAIAQAQEP